MGWNKKDIPNGRNKNMIVNIDLYNVLNLDC